MFDNYFENDLDNNFDPEFYLLSFVNCLNKYDDLSLFPVFFLCSLLPVESEILFVLTLINLLRLAGV